MKTVSVALRKSIFEETYQDVKGLIYDCVSNFKKLYGFFDEEELLSACHLAFIKAVESYQPQKGSIATWVRLHCFGYMKNAAAKAAVFHKHREIDEQRETAQYTEDFSVLEVLEGLQDDALEVAKLILDTPLELAEMCTGKKEIKTAITEFLRAKGWKYKRINRAFEVLANHLLKNKKNDC